MEVTYKPITGYGDATGLEVTYKPITGYGDATDLSGLACARTKGCEGVASSVVVQLQGLRHALPMANVLRVVNAVEVTPFPVASEAFMGIIDIAGEVIPVVDFRHVLGHDSCPVAVESAMVVVQTSRAKLVLPVDAVLGVDELAETTHPDGTSLHANCVDSFLVDSEGLIFGIDVDRLVTDDDYATFAFLPQGVGSS